MKLDTKECLEALKSYKVTNKMEEMAVKVLSTKGEDVWKIPGIIQMSHNQLDELAMIIKEVRDNIGIEED